MNFGTLELLKEYLFGRCSSSTLMNGFSLPELSVYVNSYDDIYRARGELGSGHTIGLGKEEKTVMLSIDEQMPIPVNNENIRELSEMLEMDEEDVMELWYWRRPIKEGLLHVAHVAINLDTYFLNKVFPIHRVLPFAQESDVMPRWPLIPFITPQHRLKHEGEIMTYDYWRHNLCMSLNYMPWR